MPIADLQRQMTVMGRIRLGPSMQGRRYPERLATFRFTSGNEHLIREIAALYGGAVQPWQSKRGPQFEVITETARMPVYVPQQKIDPWYEQWGRDVCQRRCDGVRDVIHDEPCVCDPDARECKPTTRVNVMLAEVPGIGVWRLETHGFYATSELSSLSDFIARVPMPVPGQLILEQRERKHFDRAEDKVLTKQYAVPVILIDSVTVRQLQVGGDALSRALRAAEGTQLETGQQPRQIEGTPAAGPQQIEPERMEKALAVIADADMNKLNEIRSYLAHLGDPPRLVTAWESRRVELMQRQIAADPEPLPPPEDTPEGPDTAAPAAATDAQPPPSTQDPDDPERKKAFMALLSAAGEQAMTTDALDTWLHERYGATRTTATAAQLRQAAIELETEAGA